MVRWWWSADQRSAPAGDVGDVLYAAPVPVVDERRYNVESSGISMKDMVLCAADRTLVTLYSRPNHRLDRCQVRIQKLIPTATRARTSEAHRRSQNRPDWAKS